MRFLKNTPSPLGMVSKDEGAGGTSTRVSVSSPSPIVPSAVKTTATVIFGASGLYRFNGDIRYAWDNKQDQILIIDESKTFRNNNTYMYMYNTTQN